MNAIPMNVECNFKVLIWHYTWRPGIFKDFNESLYKEMTSIYNYTSHLYQSLAIKVWNFYHLTDFSFCTLINFARIDVQSTCLKVNLLSKAGKTKLLFSRVIWKCIWVSLLLVPLGGKFGNWTVSINISPTSTRSYVLLGEKLFYWQYLKYVHDENIKTTTEYYLHRRASYL